MRETKQLTDSPHELDVLVYEAEQGVQQLSASPSIPTTLELENAANSLRTAANANLTLVELAKRGGHAVSAVRRSKERRRLARKRGHVLLRKS